MSERIEYKRAGLVSLLLTIASGLAAVPGSVAEARPSTACREAVRIEAGTTFRGLGPESGCFELAVPAAGLALVTIVGREGEGAEPRLSLAGLCDPAGAPTPESVRLSGESLLLRTREARGLLLCARERDPRRALAELRLESSFLRTPESIEVDPDPRTPESIEVDPDPRTPESIEVDPDPKTPESIEVDPDPRTPLGAGSPGWEALCRSGEELDDHGDAFPCATAWLGGIGLERVVTGQIRNGRGDDSDTFSILLPAEGLLEVEGVAELELAAGLYDAFGHRLASVTGGEESVQLSRWLEAGLYFLRIQGLGASEGAYALAARLSEPGW